jgi:phosphate transport system substrate-binding protein
MKLRAQFLAIAGAAGLVATPALAAPVEVDKQIAPYQKTSGISGNLNSIGSDTLNNLMTLWSEGFRKQYPNVRIQVEGKGSSTAPPALIEGTAQIGPMSRGMKDKEVDAFEASFGYKPTQIRVAVDALAVYVHKDNPVKQLTLPQVDAIFSANRSCGAPAPITTWGEAGATGAWANKPISLYGRNSASGTYGYFKKVALCKGDYRDTVKEQPGSASVVQGVTEDLYGVGYSGIGYRTSGVKALALAKKAGEAFGTVEAADVYGGRYPLARYLYLYINKKPNDPADPLVREFVRYVLSAEGQHVVVKDGYLPLSHEVASQELGKLTSQGIAAR